jgi:hypothetical protein
MEALVFEYSFKVKRARSIIVLWLFSILAKLFETMSISLVYLAGFL